MDQIKSVGIREFRANLHKYTRQNLPLAITSHGEPIGYYIPAKPSPQQQEFVALKEAARKISEILKESGISSDEIVADFQKARHES